MGKKIQFLLKNNCDYSFALRYKSSGLSHSVSHVAKALKQEGFHPGIAYCQDNNEIDREVTRFKPDIAIIEALWVVPEKFNVLKKLHPKVKWFVRIHSDIPFLALEGISVQWLNAYLREGVGVLTNSLECLGALKNLPDYDYDHHPAQLAYLPNIYLSHTLPLRQNRNPFCLNIGCFGAIRPFKNQLIQALAALQFAKEKNLPLLFWMNTTRVETGGAPVLKNIRQLFQDSGETLIETSWVDPSQFQEILRDMDLGMQVSLTETYNIVCADYVTAGIPVVASSEVSWLSPKSCANPHSIKDIVKKMHRAYHSPSLIRTNQRLLKRSSGKNTGIWIKWLSSL